MLPAEKRALCDECHDDIVEIAENSPVQHSPTTTQEECIGCHDPHASNNAPMLRKPQRDLCLSCHDRAVESGDDKLIDKAAWLDKHEVWHEPITEDNCTGCHRPHGSKNFRLLKKPFPRSFYAPFAVEDYGLCFSCHERTLVTSKNTRSTRTSETETGTSTSSTSTRRSAAGPVERVTSCTRAINPSTYGNASPTGAG